MKIRFLLDENLSPHLRQAVLHLNPDIDILRIGNPGTPPLGTLDPEILSYLELWRRLLVTDNRKSMPALLKEYWETGGHIWGLLWIRPNTEIGRLAAELLIIWETTEAEEWIDVTDWIPL